MLSYLPLRFSLTFVLSFALLAYSFPPSGGEAKPWSLCLLAYFLVSLGSLLFQDYISLPQLCARNQKPTSLIVRKKKKGNVSLKQLAPTKPLL